VKPSRFTRLGGLGALLGGTLWVATLGVAQLLSADLTGIVVAPVLCLLLGIAALQARQARNAGRLGGAGFLVSLLGCVVLAYGSVGNATLNGTVAGIVYGPLVLGGLAPGALLFGVGTGMLAMSSIAANVLPRLSPVPLLIGAVGVTVAGGWAIGHQLLDGAPAPIFPVQTAPLLGLWAIFGVGWLWLGYLLWTEGRHDPSVR
jgi:hypothetical protein